MDEVDVHQLRNVISETKEIVHLYLEVFQGLVEQTEVVKKVVPYNVENVVSDNVEECPEEETVAMNTVEEKNLYEFGRLTDKTLSNGEESNEGWTEDEFTHGKKASDIFYGMSPIPDCLDPIVEPGPFHSLGPNDDMFVRQTYDNKQQLIFSLSLKATREKFQFKTKHSNKNRYEVYCEIENCSWRLYAKRLDPTDEFEIRTFNNMHTCSSLQIHPNHKHANKKVMGTILHEIMGKTRSKFWRPNEISRDLNVLLEINVDYKQSYKYGWCPFEGADAIRVSIENVFPYDHHGLCAFQLLGNIVHKFGKYDKTKVFLWRLAKAYKRNVFEELWYRFRSTRPQVASYLSEIPRECFICRAESMNALSVDVRKMPIIPLLEFFRRLSQEWCNKCHIEGGKRSTVLIEWAEKVVSKNEERTT
uniref:Transposase MuDR plant domain-containing protein n=1 Tax=Lactuca sativa TaxID=4236 RepID=A0A9R1UTJ3_LACSA|nr:hypothetical protein LSAT_V11C800401390 [Lactuca sativa]